MPSLLDIPDDANDDQPESQELYPSLRASVIEMPNSSKNPEKNQNDHPHHPITDHPSSQCDPNHMAYHPESNHPSQSSRSTRKARPPWALQCLVFIFVIAGFACLVTSWIINDVVELEFKIEQPIVDANNQRIGTNTFSERATLGFFGYLKKGPNVPDFYGASMKFTTYLMTYGCSIITGISVMLLFFGLSHQLVSDHGPYACKSFRIGVAIFGFATFMVCFDTAFMAFLILNEKNIKVIRWHLSGPFVVAAGINLLLGEILACAL